MGNKWQFKKLAIVAGGGALPFRLIDVCRARDIPFHLIRILGESDEELASFAASNCGLAEAGKLLKILQTHECDAVVLAGIVRRPDFSALKPDLWTVKLLPRVIKAAISGDGALLAMIVTIFEENGFAIIGADQILSDQFVLSGNLGNNIPNKDDLADIKKAAHIVTAIGPFDVGQGAIVCEGQVVAVEAVEGTDQMLQRCQKLRSDLSFQERSGVLVKIPKPEQELRVDMPTIGIKTIELAIAAGLSGIAFAKNKIILLDPDPMIALANDSNFFIYGFDLEECLSS